MKGITKTLALVLILLCSLGMTFLLVPDMDPLLEGDEAYTADGTKVIVLAVDYESGTVRCVQQGGDTAEVFVTDPDSLSRDAPP